MNPRSLRIAVLLSGRGSNLDALIQQVHRADDVPARIVGVVANRPGAGGLARARAAGITSACVDHRAFSGREAFEAVLATTLEALEPDLLLLAGFMRILTPGFVERFSPRMLNIHPSLLPDFPGLDTHARALQRGDAEAGASVHVVTPELDSGPVLARVRVPVEPDDDPQRLEARVRAAEHLLYPAVTAWVASGRLELDARTPRLDGRPLPPQGIDHRVEEGRLRPCSREHEDSD